MQVSTLPVGMMQANCYMLRADNDDAAIIDPGDEAERILQWIQMEGVQIKGIWLTHGHFDHSGAAERLRAACGAPIIACSEEERLLLDVHQNLSLDVQQRSLVLRPDLLYADGESFPFGEETVCVLHTPGHTSGSCCYLVGSYLFTGDTLFAGSIGRTDFPTGDFMAMRLSLQKLCMLDKNYTVLPGHGPATTLAAERKSNPYLI